MQNFEDYDFKVFEKKYNHKNAKSFFLAPVEEEIIMARCSGHNIATKTGQYSQKCRIFQLQNSNLYLAFLVLNG
jgi:hypothetical protein